MGSKVLVVYVKKTGHVLAALTRSTDPDGTANLEQVVTPDLRVRLLSSKTTLGAPGILEFAVPKEHLGTMVTDEIDDLLKRPRTFKLADPTKETSALEKLPTPGPPPPTGQIHVLFPPPVTVPPTPRAPALYQNKIDVTMVYAAGSNAPDKATPVWVLIKRDEDNVQIVAGEIKPKELIVSIPLLVPVGSGEPRQVLILAGQSPWFAETLTAAP